MTCFDISGMIRTVGIRHPVIWVINRERCFKVTLDNVVKVHIDEHLAADIGIANLLAV